MDQRFQIFTLTCLDAWLRSQLSVQIFRVFFELLPICSHWCDEISAHSDYRFLALYKFSLCTYVCTLCPKKVVHQTHGNNLVNSLRIFKILSLLDKRNKFSRKPI